MKKQVETRVVKMVEISARFNCIVPMEYLHFVLQVIAELRDYGDADVTSLREVEDDA